MQTYRTIKGETLPVVEATRDRHYQVYREDVAISVKGDPRHCFNANGMLHDPNVEEAYFGHGRDVYTVLKEPHVVEHGIANDKSHNLAAQFEANQELQTQTIVIKAAAPSMTLEARAAYNKNNATKPRKPRKKKSATSVVETQRTPESTTPPPMSFAAQENVFTPQPTVEQPKAEKPATKKLRLHMPRRPRAPIENTPDA